MSVIVDINHETGDLMEYDSTVTDGGDLSAAQAASLANTNWGLSCLLDDTTAIYGEASISAPATYFRARFYIDPNGLTMGDGDVFDVYRLRAVATRIVVAQLQYVSGTGYQLVTLCYDDGGSSYTLATTTITDAQHYAEVYLKKSATAVSNDAICTWYIDGSQVGTKTDLDLFTNFGNMDNMRLGAIAGIDAGTSGTFYLDELVANDDGGLIGPVPFVGHGYPACFDGPTVF